MSCAEADVGLGPLERQRHRFDAVDLLNGDAYAVRADGAVHAEDLQLDARVLGMRLDCEEEQDAATESMRACVTCLLFELSPFDVAQGDPEPVCCRHSSARGAPLALLLRGDFAPRSGRRRYFRQKKYVKLTPKRNFSSGWKFVCWYTGKSRPASSPYCL